MEGHIHSLETFAAGIDGPGCRYVVFLKGCHMRCKFCHNPDTWSLEGGDIYTPEELFEKAYRYKNYWMKRDRINGDTFNGGITVSGGEPLLQIEFVTEFFKLAKSKGVPTALDTSANPFTREEPFFGKFTELMKYTDLVLFDIKDIRDENHRELTGHTNENILDCIKYLDEIGKPVWLRHVLVPGGSDDDEQLTMLHEFLETLHNIERIEILPYHTLGIQKWENLNIPYPLEGVEPPTKERIINAKKILNTPFPEGYV